MHAAGIIFHLARHADFTVIAAGGNQNRFGINIAAGGGDFLEFTFFLNSHNLEEVSRVCSKVAILHRGAIRAYDTVDHLRTGPEGTEIGITLANPAETMKAIRVLSGTEGAGTARQEDDLHVTVFLSGGSGFPVIRALVAAGVVVEEVQKRKRSLEEIYLETVRQSGETER